MGSVMTTMFFFIAVTVLASIVFGGWLLWMIFRLIGRTIGLLLGGCRYDAAEMLPGNVDRRCGNPSCRARNPVSAKFCRRCGRAMAGGPVASWNPPPPQTRPVGGAQRWDPTAELAAGERNRI